MDDRSNIDPSRICVSAWIAGRSMKRFIEGLDRGQSTLLPECLDDWIDDDNPARAVDVFVDGLDLVELGFDGVVPEATGRPSYHPSALLKLYIYGYLNRVQSSRRLEHEAARNLEVIGLLRRLTPDDKTIADFRKDIRPGRRDIQGDRQRRPLEETTQVSARQKRHRGALEAPRWQSANAADDTSKGGALHTGVADHLARVSAADHLPSWRKVAGRQRHPEGNPGGLTTPRPEVSG